MLKPIASVKNTVRRNWSSNAGEYIGEERTVRSRVFRNFLLLGAVIAGALMIAYPYLPRVSAAVKNAKDRNPAPGFTLKDPRGRDLTLSDYKGKVVLLNFWATWCGPCKIEIPWFIEFEKSYNTRGFAVVGISMDEDGWNAVKPYVEQKQMNYRVAIGDDGLAQKYGGIDSLPTTFLIDRAGRVAAVHMGLVSKNVYEREIQELLAERTQVMRIGS
jgi:thiol-disulfide isomerase/thioredoxin